jgi:hypothetical protein
VFWVGLPKRQPDQLGIGIGQRAQRHFPDGIGNAAGLVENQHDALALVVQPGKGLGIVLAPGHEVTAPALLVAGRGGGQRAAGLAKPVGRQRKVRPLGDFRPGLGVELAFGIGGHQHARIGAGVERPLDHHRHQRRLADPVARGPRQPQGAWRVAGSARWAPISCKTARCQARGPFIPASAPSPHG